MPLLAPVTTTTLSEMLAVMIDAYAGLKTVARSKIAFRVLSLNGRRTVCPVPLPCRSYDSEALTCRPHAGRVGERRTQV